MKGSREFISFFVTIVGIVIAVASLVVAMLNWFYPFNPVGNSPVQPKPPSNPIFIVVTATRQIQHIVSTAPQVESTQIPTKKSISVIEPTATLRPVKTVSESCADVSITVSDTSMGDVLHIRQCSSWAYDAPPLSKGVYALSPEKKYVIYCTKGGDVYMIKIGDSNLVFIENLKVKMPAFLAEDVLIKITFSKDDIHHYALIQDLNSGQEETVKIPPYMYQ